MGSADLMPRNLDTRVELVAPIEDPVLADEVVDVLERGLADTVDAWELGEDGEWRKLDPGDEPRSVQRELMDRHARRAAEAAATAG
jgi:polyphosphate kinase